MVPVSTSPSVDESGRRHQRPGGALSAIAAVAPVVGLFAVAVLLSPPRAALRGDQSLLAAFLLIGCGTALIAALVLMIVWFRQQPSGHPALGLGTSGLVPTLRELAIPTAAGVGLLLAIETAQPTGFDEVESFDLDWIREFLTYFGWAVFQQILILGYVFRRLRKEGLGVRGAILVSAAVFGMLHLPNMGLVAFAIPSGLIWTWSYSRHGSLLGVAISHVIIGTVMTHFLDMKTEVGIPLLEWLTVG